MNQSFLWFMASIMLVSSFGLTAFAEEEPYTPYEESRGQVNFDDLEVVICGRNQIALSVDESLGWFSRFSGKRELAKAEAFLDKNPAVEEALAQEMAEGEGNLMAVGYTIAPLVEVDGHYERVKKENKLLNLLLAPIAGPAAVQGQKNLIIL